MFTAIEFLRYAFNIGAIEFTAKGRELRSGRITPYFFNMSLFHKGRHLFVLAQSYVHAIGKKEIPNVIFGRSYKGIAPAVAISLVLRGEVGWAYDRKEAKNHGEGGIIIGEHLDGKRVGLLDDVMTEGRSMSKAVDIVHANGGIPVWAAIAFDRQERGEGQLSAVQEFEKNYQIPVVTIATLDDLINLMQIDAPENQFLPMILEYKAQYGV